MKRTILLALVAGFLHSKTALAQEPMLKLAPSSLELPVHIGPLTAEPEPYKYDEPGMGVSYEYSMPGAALTVYIYDDEVPDIQDGADTIPACVEFEGAKQGVMEAYQQPKLVSQYLVKLLPTEGSPLMREAVFEIVNDGRSATSYVWITAVAKQFIKLRFTIDQRLRDELPDARQAILSAFGTAIKPHLAPVEPKAKQPGASIGFNMDSLNDDLGAAGFMYTILLSAIADKDPDSKPVCGGEFIPSYVTELGLYRSLFVDESDGRKTRFGKQIVKAEEAGFLDELVWVEVHRQVWGDTPPVGLALPEYAGWRKKNLKNFRRPSFGSVNFEYPRPLPPEPAL